jgi:alpha-tubulin suppressor-like RCC1 family protein
VEIRVDRCICHERTFEELKARAEEQGITTLEALLDAEDFGRTCHGCHPYVKRMLETGETVFTELLGLLGIALLIFAPGALATTVSVGGAHTCVIEDGSARCFGRGAEGQLGDPAVSFAKAPGVVLPARGVRELALGARHTCARTDAGVTCWGENGRGQISAKGLPAVKRIASGEDFSCALAADGRVLCWGDNSYQQCGASGAGAALAPRAVAGVEGAVKIALGDHHACALDGAGAVRCWGAGYAGQRGDGSRRPSGAPVVVEGLVATDLAAGGAHTCAATAEGVRCFGAGGQGQLANGSTIDRDRPVEAEVPAGALTLGRGLSCGVEAGKLRCAGALPLEAEGVTSVAAAFDHVCVVSGRGVRCAGANDGGQLGVDLGGAPRTKPVLLDAGPAQRVRAALGVSCVEIEGAPARCRGVGSSVAAGALLAGTTNICAVGMRASCVPARPALERLLERGDMRRALEVAIGDDDACGRAADGRVRCGGGDMSAGALRVAAGRGHACALLGDGALSCRGENLQGQLGLGDRRARDGASRVRAPIPFVSVAAGWDTTCAVARGGKLACFGAGFGTRPVEVIGMRGVQKIVVGRRHACALVQGGKVRCFGANDRGQLGRGDLAARPLPGFVEALTDVVDLDAGADHTCALTRKGRALCWGDNARGEVEAATLFSASWVPLKVGDG